MSLKDLIARDNTRIFMNTLEFCEHLTFQCGQTRVQIVGSLQSNNIQNNSGNTNPLQAVSWTLYTQYPLISQFKLHTGARITLNDVVYTVDTISDELGICSIGLRTAQGR